MIRRIIAAATLFLGTTLATYPAFAESVPTASPNSLSSPNPSVLTADKAQTEAVIKRDLVDQKTQQREMDRMNLDYFKGYATDAGKIVTSPLRWDPKDWIKFGLVLGGTGTLLLIDKEVNEFTQKNRKPVLSGLASVGNFIGDPLVVFPAVGAFYLYGELSDDSKIRRTALLALESLTISGVLTEGLKQLSGRPRPESGQSPLDWHGPGADSECVSFSSGHTGSAFALATVIANEYQDVPYVAPTAYGLATLTALARIYSNKHWASDTLLGAAIGHFVSKAVLDYHKEDKKGLGSRLSLAPQVGNEMTGLTVNYQF